MKENGVQSSTESSTISYSNVEGITKNEKPQNIGYIASVKSAG